MKIGILTFHWAVNYGAILQTYALQKFLEVKGHEVRIINYKPKTADLSILYYLKSPRRTLSLIKHYKEIKRQKSKDVCLDVFRSKYLHLTTRCYTREDVAQIVSNYDILISGSDQILNPQFTLNGEGHPTSVYYLDFECMARKVGYAVSFGCTTYPQKASEYAMRWIQNFDTVGTREESGIKILRQLGYSKSSKIVPDPTVLCGKSLFDNIKLHIEKKDYTYVYLLHNRILDVKYTSNTTSPILYADSDVHKTSMIRWLEDIASAKQIITNSYHGMIMSIIFHVPFVVLLESNSGVGMNDRFTTLLSRLQLLDRVVANNAKEINATFLKEIDWRVIDFLMTDYKRIGDNFLNF